MWKWLYGPILMTKIDRLGTYAAAMAYCLVLSVVPFLIVTFTLAQNLPFHLNKSHRDELYREVLSDILPTDVDATQVVATIDKSLEHGGLSVIGFILAIYTSYNLMTQIVRTLLFVFDDPKRPHDWNWVHWIKSMVLLLIWMVLPLTIAISFAVSLGVTHFLEVFDLPQQIHRLIIVGQDALVLVMMFGAFFLTFRLVPSKRLTRDQARDGSIVASLGWILCSLLFGHLLLPLVTTGAVYEALGSVVIILLWAQACAWSVIAGACWIVRFSPRR
jgi:YihY family inner membrane protein